MRSPGRAGAAAGATSVEELITMDRGRAPADTARALAAMLLDAALGPARQEERSREV